MLTSDWGDDGMAPVFAITLVEVDGGIQFTFLSVTWPVETHAYFDLLERITDISK